MTQLLEARHPQSIRLAADWLRRGEVIALPTDTVYGVGALALDAPAVAKIYRVKDRPPDKAIPVFVGSVAELSLVCGEFSADVLPLLNKYWPGGLTVVLPASPTLPEIVTGGGHTIAVRIPDHPVVMALLAEVKQPLAVTSANLSGLPTPATAPEILRQLEGRLPLILDDGPSPGGIPSTILDLTQSPPQILRQGAVTLLPAELK